MKLSNYDHFTRFRMRKCPFEIDIFTVRDTKERTSCRIGRHCRRGIWIKVDRWIPELPATIDVKANRVLVELSQSWPWKCDNWVTRIECEKFVTETFRNRRRRANDDSPSFITFNTLITNPAINHSAKRNHYGINPENSPRVGELVTQERVSLSGGALLFFPPANSSLSMREY